MQRRAAAAFSSAAAATRALSRCLRTSASAAIRATMVRWHEDRKRGGGGDQGIASLLEDLGVGGRKGDDARRPSAVL
jgi:hypothetical protein